MEDKVVIDAIENIDANTKLQEYLVFCLGCYLHSVDNDNKSGAFLDNPTDYDKAKAEQELVILRSKIRKWVDEHPNSFLDD